MEATGTVGAVAQAVETILEKSGIPTTGARRTLYVAAGDGTEHELKEGAMKGNGAEGSVEERVLVKKGGIVVSRVQEGNDLEMCLTTPEDIGWPQSVGPYPVEDVIRATLGRVVDIHQVAIDNSRLVVLYTPRTELANVEFAAELGIAARLPESGEIELRLMLPEGLEIPESIGPLRTVDLIQMLFGLAVDVQRVYIDPETRNNLIVLWKDGQK